MFGYFLLNLAILGGLFVFCMVLSIAIAIFIDRGVGNNLTKGIIVGWTSGWIVALISFVLSLFIWVFVL